MKTLVLVAATALFASNALAIDTYFYHCTTQAGLWDDSPLELELRGNEARGQLEGSDFSGWVQADAKYRPRNPKNARYNRYPHVDNMTSESGYVNLFVEKEMSKGAQRGTAKLEWTGEAFSSGFYACTRTK